MMLRHVQASLLIWGPALFFAGCLRDFGQFEAREKGGDGGLGGASSDGGASSGDGDSGGSTGDGDGDSGGSGDTGGDDGCGADLKLCGSDCVPDDDPTTGCAAASCAACPSETNAMVACVDGACGIVGCEPGFADCDGSGGCEHSPGMFDASACGGCEADCGTLGLTQCTASGTCGCLQDVDCELTTNVSDNARKCGGNGLCSCSETECNPGEICQRNGNSASCRCNTKGPCSSGSTCCPGANEPYCANTSGNDNNNCGACGWKCPAGTACNGGVCE